MKFTKLYAFGCVLLVITLAGSVFAQPAVGGAGARVYQEQLRVELDSQDPADREIGFDAGGWFNYALFNYRDSTNRTRTLNQFQLRGWASFNYKNIHHAYFRGLLNWDRWANGDNPHIKHNDNTNFKETVERAWYAVDVDRLLGSEPGKDNPIDFRFKVGREYMTIGTAFTLAAPLDMVEFDLRVRDVKFRAMLGKTVSDFTNMDTSIAVADNQRRCMYGFELTYLGLPQHRPFAYYWAQSDHSGTNGYVPEANQRYDYSSRYFGIGSQGSIFLPRLNYSVEFVGETGSTYSFRSGDRKDDICAFGADLQLMYTFDTKMTPQVKFEYMWGSGDGDRAGSSSATFGGNKPGSKDKAFNAFGYRDTGIAFAPRVSNIHIWMLNGSFRPFEDSGNEFIKRMEIGSSVFFYAKDKGHGPISDPAANARSSKWLGWEWDVYCNWRITSDLSWTARYGIFQPGSSTYSGAGDGSRHFLYTGMSLSF